MDISLTSRPRKLKRISTPGLKGMDYQQQLDICRELERENPHFVDYVLKPATDEMWNLMDGKRTIGEIIDCSLLEFDLNTKPATWLIVFAGWCRAGLIAIGSD
jgi:hypothetical protein